MSREETSGKLRFYQTLPTPCPYLPNRMEQKLFTLLNHEEPAVNAALNSHYSALGFRRSQTMLYRPSCATCQACIPLRVLARDFLPSRTHRRLLKKHQGWQWKAQPPVATQELFDLFHAYEQTRHADSDMAHMGYDEFRAMIEEGAVPKAVYALTTETGHLIGAMLVDRLADGLSAVYSFFDPMREHDSIGTLMVLRLIESTAGLSLPYAYLGYWIDASPKMAYKKNFQPAEILTPRGWEKQPA